MNSIDVDTTLSSEEPTKASYEDSLEGMLQYHADRSLWFKQQANEAKTSFKREYYTKKLHKNNKNLWKLLVRTPNAYNPLMKYLEAPATDEASDEGTVNIPFSQVIDENDTIPTGVISTSEDAEVK